MQNEKNKRPDVLLFHKAKEIMIKRIIFLSVMFWCAVTYLLFYMYVKEHPTDLIASVTVSKHRVDVVPNAAFKQAYLIDDFFVEYANDIDLTKLDYSIVTMPFLMHVIAIVWISGEKYYIDSMDENLYRSLVTVREVFKKMYPRTSWSGQLIPRKLVPNTSLVTQKDAIALPFSTGLDSSYSSLKHLDKKQLLITEWGRFDTPLDDLDLWNVLNQRIASFAEKFGHERTIIRSNYRDILNCQRLDNISPDIDSWSDCTLEGLARAGLVAPILLTKGCSALYVASTFTWDFPYSYAANPFVDNNILFADVRIKHD